MARFHYTQSAAGIGAGTIKCLPDSLAAELVREGIGYIEKEAVSAPLNTKAEQVTTTGVNAPKTAPKRAKKQSK